MTHENPSNPTDTYNLVSNERLVQRGEATALPDGYRYGTPAEFDAASIESLMRGSFTDEEIWNAYLGTREEDLSRAGMREIDVMIATNDSQLVGFGNIVARNSQGVLNDLIVDPVHRHNGLAQAIVLERLAMADELVISSLYIPPISELNTLEGFYIEQGFSKQLDSSFVRGPEPKNVLKVV
jgi:LPS sulfotransferase NodH